MQVLRLHLLWQQNVRWKWYRLWWIKKKKKFCFQVPFGSVAFMPGRLIHTNEIMVLLGDNWFAERSASQALEMVERRKKCTVFNFMYMVMFCNDGGLVENCILSVLLFIWSVCELGCCMDRYILYLSLNS